MNLTGVSVSSPSENLILVSPDDEFIGTTTKVKAHQPGGLLHRAIGPTAVAVTLGTEKAIAKLLIGAPTRS
jgi:hypothetical protein